MSNLTKRLQEAENNDKEKSTSDTECLYCPRCDGVLDYYGSRCYDARNQRHNEERYYCNHCRSGWLRFAGTKEVFRVMGVEHGKEKKNTN